LTSSLERLKLFLKLGPGVVTPSLRLLDEQPGKYYGSDGERESPINVDRDHHQNLSNPFWDSSCTSSVPGP
jgi:hypothetical protein